MAEIPVSIMVNFGIRGYDASMGCTRHCNKPVSTGNPVIKLLIDADALIYTKCISFYENALNTEHKSRMGHNYQSLGLQTEARGIK